MKRTKIKFKKILKYVFSKKTIAYRKGYLHFHRGKYPKLSDNPYEKKDKNRVEWELGFSSAIEDIITLKNSKKK